MGGPLETPSSSFAFFEISATFGRTACVACQHRLILAELHAQRIHCAQYAGCSHRLRACPRSSPPALMPLGRSGTPGGYCAARWREHGGARDSLRGCGCGSVSETAQSPCHLLPGGLISAKVRPSPSSTAVLCVNSCQRVTTTSAYFGSSSIVRQILPVTSHPKSVLPAPPNKSTATLPALLLLMRERRTNSTGFMVGWSRLAAGFFSSHSVDCDLSPYQGSFCPATWQ